MAPTPEKAHHVTAGQSHWFKRSRGPSDRDHDDRDAAVTAGLEGVVDQGAGRLGRAGSWQTGRCRPHRAGSCVDRRNTAPDASSAVVIVLTFDSSNSGRSASAPNQRVSVCAPLSTTGERPGYRRKPVPAKGCRRRSGIAAARADRAASTPCCRPTLATAMCTCHRSTARRPQRYRCMTTGESNRRANSALRLPSPHRRVRPSSPMSDPRTRRAPSPWRRRRRPTQPARRSGLPADEVETPSHTTAAIAKGRSPGAPATVAAAPASSLRVCWTPRSVISTTASRWSSSRTGSERPPARAGAQRPVGSRERRGSSHRACLPRRNIRRGTACMWTLCSSNSSSLAGSVVSRARAQ